MRAFHSISNHRQPSTMFGDWLEIAAISLHQLPYNSGDFPKDKSFEKIEAQYFQAISHHDRETLNIMAAMLGITLAAYQQHFGDFLGEIASEQEFLNTRSGQFFTPYEVCRAMAKMTLHDARSLVQQKGIITIDEPASGGGALVIACAEELIDRGIDPRTHAQFQATDVSRDAFNMTYIQLSALNLQAIVRHGNTLSQQTWETRPTPQLRYFERWLRENQDIARLELLRDLMTNPEAFSTPDPNEDNAVEPDEAPPIDPPQTPALATSKEEPDEQLSLFDLDAASNPSPAKRQRAPRPADIVLPPPQTRQLDLFSSDNQLQ
jgi:N-6 DNA Methylase